MYSKLIVPEDVAVLYNKHEILENECQKELTSFFQELTEYKIKLSQVTIDTYSRYGVRTTPDDYSVRFEINFMKLDDPEKTNFGTDITFMFNSVTGIELNYGTCGSYTESDVLFIERAIIISLIWKYKNKIKYILSKYNASYIRKYNDELYKLKAEQRAKELAEKEIKLKEIEKTIKPLTLWYSKHEHCGIFIESVGNTRLTINNIKCYHITNQDYFNNNPNNEDIEKFQTHYYYIERNKSKYLNKASLIDNIYYGIIVPFDEYITEYNAEEKYR